MQANFTLFDVYHVPRNGCMLNMCLSTSDLMCSARRFEKFHYIIYWMYFFFCSSLRIRLKNFPSLYGILYGNKEKDLHF